MFHDARGSAFVVTIFLLMLLALLGLGIVATATTDLKISDNYARSVKNLYVAEAGANRAVAMLQASSTAGNLTPYPSGTPLLTGTMGPLHTYSIWMWNRRINGNGTISEFPDPRSRQFVVLARDNRQGTRRIEGIIDPARRYPGALDRAIFSCFNVTQIGGEIEGDVYAGGNLWYETSSVNTVHVEAYGTVTARKDVSGNARSGANIDLDKNDRVKGTCWAKTTINRNCKVATNQNVNPNPAKKYCDVTSPDWDPKMLNVNAATLAGVLANTPLANRYTSGWTVSSLTTLNNTNYYVTGGDCVFSAEVRYSGHVVVVCDGGRFVCNNCVMGEGNPKTSTLTVITRNKDILFQGTANLSNFHGVFWAGVVNNDGTLPAAGSIINTSSKKVELKGELVAVGGSVTSTNQLEVLIDKIAKPPLFGEAAGYAITEWREVR